MKKHSVSHFEGAAKRVGPGLKSGLILPRIPNKRYFTIGEVSDLCVLKPHILRYWEQEFPELNPTKRRGNRRYYQREDIMLIRLIRQLLYEEGFTIVGARLQLQQVLSRQAVLEAADLPDLRQPVDATWVKTVLQELRAIVALIPDFC
jgi:DNA-binding transcriptional MerR regulator